LKSQKLYSGNTGTFGREDLEELKSSNLKSHELLDSKSNKTTQDNKTSNIESNENDF
jgi:hypothetical protein